MTDMRAQQKKRVRTAALVARDQGMRMPVLLQRVALRTPESAAAGSPEVYHDGYLTLVDLLSVAAWPVLRSGLRQWAAVSSTVPACLTLSDSRGLLGVDWAAAEAPALALMDALVDAGWHYGAPPRDHTLDSTKAFSVRDPIAAKSYLRCLLQMDRLVGTGSGQLATLRSDQRNRYYACVLASGQPRDVPVDAPAAVYQTMLTELATGVSGQPRPAEALPAGKDSSEDGLEFGSAGWEVAQTASVARQRGQRGRKRAASTSDGWRDLVPGMLRDRPVDGGQPAPGVLADQPADPGSAASPSGPHAAPALRGMQQDPPAEGGQLAPADSNDQLAEAVGGEDSSVAPAPRAKRQCARQPARSARQQQGTCVLTENWLHGQQVSEEAHGALGQPGSYRRLSVFCPHHPRCQKRRNYDTRDSREGIKLGHVEPLAYLGCWLKGGRNFETAREHIAWGPSRAAVSAYVREEQWQEVPAAEGEGGED